MLGAGHIAPPAIVWTSVMAPRALGRHIVLGSEMRAIAEGKPAASLDATIELHRSILASESTLARVVAHETIHHVESGLLAASDAQRWLDLSRAGYRHDGHGRFFLDSAKKVNELVGDPGFVTVKSDDSYELSKHAEKQYFLFIYKIESGRYGYSWTTRLGPAAKDYVILKIRDNRARVVTTTDLYWANTGRKLAAQGYVSVPSDAERKLELEALFEGGNPEYSLALIRAPRENPNALGVLPARPLGQTLGRRRRG